MGYYIIKNITNELAKRHSKINTAQKIEFKDIIGSSSVSINTGAEITLETNYLPVTAQKLRTEGLITIVEIDRDTYQKQLNAQDAKIYKESQDRNIEKSPEMVEEDDSMKKYKLKRK